MSYLWTPDWRAPRRSEHRQKPRTAWWPVWRGTALSPAGSWQLRCGKSLGTRTPRMTDSSLRLGRTWRVIPRLGSPKSRQSARRLKRNATRWREALDRLEAQSVTGSVQLLVQSWLSRGKCRGQSADDTFRCCQNYQHPHVSRATVRLSGNVFLWKAMRLYTLF